LVVSVGWILDESITWALAEIVVSKQ